MNSDLMQRINREDMMMQELLKMMEALFANTTGKENQDESDTSPKHEEKWRKMSRVKHACASVLMRMRQEIEALEHVLTVLDARREALIEEHNALVGELWEIDAEQEQAPFQTSAAEEEEHRPQNNPEEQNPQEMPRPAAPTTPLSGDNSDTGARLEKLEKALYQTVATLKGTKMASFFTTVKALLADLCALMNATEQSRPERIETLIAALQRTVEVLGGNSVAFKAKTIRQLRSDLFVLLENEATSQP